MPATERRQFGALLLVGWLALVAIHLVLGAGVDHPRLGPGDQWGYVGNARFIAGEPGVYAMPYFPYFTFGYSIVLAPIVRLSHDPHTVFLAIKVLNACLAASLLPLLYASSRVILRASRPSAYLAALAGALVPSVVAHTTSILAENLVYPLVVVAALAAHACLSDRPGWQRVWFGPAVGFLFCVHNRFVVVLPIVFVVLAIAVRVRRTPWVIALVNGGAALAVYLGTVATRDVLIAARWTDGVEASHGGAAEALESAGHLSFVGDVLLTAAGQVWYVAATTLGLAAIGIVAAVQRVADRRDGPSAAADAPDEGAARLTLGFMVASAVAVLALSAFIFTKVLAPSEGFIAGRHNESFVPFWVATGVVALLERRGRSVVLPLAVAGVTILLGLWVSIGRSGDMGELYSSLNVPAVVPFVTEGESVVPFVTIVSVVVLLLIAGVQARTSRRWPLVLVVLLAGTWFVGAQATIIDTDADEPAVELRAELERLGVDQAAVVQERFGGVPSYFQFFVPSLEVAAWDGEGEPPGPFVLAEEGASFGDRGAAIVALDPGHRRYLSPGTYAVALWVFPGPEQDRLEAAGELLPEPP